MSVDKDYARLNEQATIRGWHPESLPTPIEYSNIQFTARTVRQFGGESKFACIDIPADIFEPIKHRFEEGISLYRTFKEEPHSPITPNIHMLPNLTSGSIGHGDRFYGQIHTSKKLVAIHEEFADIKLEPTMWYGPRVYRKGALLRYHIDKPATHLISTSITIDCSHESSWPILVELDNSYFEVQVNPGQALIYQGAAQPHFRPFPLESEFSASIFFHYKPALSE